MAVGVFSAHIFHKGKDITEMVLAVDDQDAFAFLDDKYGERVNVICGGSSTATADQVTKKAQAEISKFN